MKTSKVKSIQGDPKFWEANQVYYHNLEMENGDKLNIGKKRKLNIGDELTYEITGDDQHEYRKAKSVQKQNPQGGNSSNASYSLSYAKDIVCSLDTQIWGVEVNIKDSTLMLADEFLKWLNENS